MVTHWVFLAGVQFLTSLAFVGPMTAAGVGQWITRFRYKRESDDEIIEDTNHAASASFDFLRRSVHTGSLVFSFHEKKTLDV